jgi:hypothetical protein
MNKLATVLVTLCLLFVFVGRAEASYYYTAPSIPWVVDVNQCIGGQICGGTNNQIYVSVPSGNIGFVEIRAHDNIGQTHKAHLEVYVDGSLVGNKDVLATTSTAFRKSVRS